MNYQLRQATLADLDAILTLFQETIHSVAANDYPEDQRKLWAASAKNRERWQQKLQALYFVVAEQDGQILGFSSLKDGNYLDHMYVHKDHLRKGIAQALYDHIQDKALQQGATSLSSDVSKTARPFFERQGFEVIRENQNIVEGTVIINYHMQWRPL